MSPTQSFKRSLFVVVTLLSFQSWPVAIQAGIVQRRENGPPEKPME